MNNNRLFLDSVNNGVIVLDDELTIHFFNSWLEAHTEKKRDTVIGKKITEVFPEVKKATLKRKVNNCLKLKSPTFYDAEIDKYLFEIPTDNIIYSSFEFMQQNITIAPYNIDDGLVSIMIYDQTQFLEMKRRCTDFNKELKRRVTEEVSKQKEQEELLLHQSRMASMGEMIENISHQWKQPLNSLSVHLQMLHDEHIHNNLSNKFIENFYEKTLFSVQKMASTIDDFKNFFKVNKKRKDFYIKKVLDDSLRLVESYYKKYNIELDISIEEDFILNGYDNELIHVFVNILSNAKDAILDKKVKDPRVKISVYKKDEFITIEIEDNAGGIPEENLETVFVPYFTTKEEGKGTGIGLYMSKRIIVEHLKGKISVSNRENGACFKVELLKS